MSSVHSAMPSKSIVTACDASVSPGSAEHQIDDKGVGDANRLSLHKPGRVQLARHLVGQAKQGPSGSLALFARRLCSNRSMSVVPRW